MAAFAAGMIASTAVTRAKAQQMTFPGWVRPGACLIAPGGGAMEVVVELQGEWMKVRPARPTAATDPPEQWRNLAVLQWLERRSDENCRRAQ